MGRGTGATTGRKLITPSLLEKGRQKQTRNHYPFTALMCVHTPPEHKSRQSYGGHSGRETPGPTPNPEATLASDDTVPPGVESRSSPNMLAKQFPATVVFWWRLYIRLRPLVSGRIMVSWIFAMTIPAGRLEKRSSLRAPFS